jgi:hypothetical protein
MHSNFSLAQTRVAVLLLDPRGLDKFYFVSYEVIGRLVEDYTAILEL